MKYSFKMEYCIISVAMYIASPGIKEFGKLKFRFQSLNSASFTGFPLKRKRIAFI